MDGLSVQVEVVDFTSLAGREEKNILWSIKRGKEGRVLLYQVDRFYVFVRNEGEGLKHQVALDGGDVANAVDNDLQRINTRVLFF